MDFSTTQTPATKSGGGLLHDTPVFRTDSMICYEYGNIVKAHIYMNPGHNFEKLTFYILKLFTPFTILKN